MITHFLSRYRPRYIRSLAYMLQASEYHIGDFLAWFHRTSNFNVVEIRKHLKMTPKAVLVLAVAWGLVCIVILCAVWLFSLSTSVGYVLGTLILVALPYILAYGVAVLLLFVQVLLQKPIEYVLIQQAKRTLGNHSGVKIAIAGSFGKTTMREILKTVLSEGKNVAAPPYSYNTPLGISAFVKTLKGNEDVLIFEMGEYYPGDVRILCELVQPDIGIITGVNEAHLHKFKTLERTAATIFELADHLGDRPTYVNGESELAGQNARSKHIVYSRTGTRELKVENAHTDLQGTSFTVLRNGSTSAFSSSLLGLHQIGPLVAAVDVAFRLGLSLEDAQKGVARTKPFDHRLEPKHTETGIVTLDDSYNGNPSGVKAAIEFLASLKSRRRIYVTPGLVEMGRKTEKVHTAVGVQLAKAGIEKVVLIKNSVTPYIEQGLQSADYQGEVIWFNDALQAFSTLPYTTVEGDVVLLQNDWPDQYV